MYYIDNMGKTFNIEDNTTEGILTGKCKLCPYALEINYKSKNMSFESAYQEMLKKFSIHSKNDHKEDVGDEMEENKNKIEEKNESEEDEYEEEEKEEKPAKNDEFTVAHRERPKTPEEMMLEEMVQLLNDLLSKAPGASNVGWIVEQFKRNPVYQEDAHVLYNLITKHAPKMIPEDVESVVNAVMAIKNQYIKESTYKPRFGQSQSPYYEPRFQPPQSEYRPGMVFTRGGQSQVQPPYPGQGAMDYHQIIQFVTEMINREREEWRKEREREELQRRLDELQRQQLEIQKSMREDILKMQQAFQQEILRLHTEKSRNVDDETRKELQELRKQQMEQLKESYQRELDRMQEVLREQQEQLDNLVSQLNDAYKERQTNDYKTDDARLIADSIKTAADTAKSLAEENKKTRLELAKLAGKIMVQSIGGEEVGERELNELRNKKPIKPDAELDNILNQITDKE